MVVEFSGLSGGMGKDSLSDVGTCDLKLLGMLFNSFLHGYGVLLSFREVGGGVICSLTWG